MSMPSRRGCIFGAVGAVAEHGVDHVAAASGSTQMRATWCLSRTVRWRGYAVLEVVVPDQHGQADQCRTGDVDRAQVVRHATSATMYASRASVVALLDCRFSVHPPPRSR